MSKKEPKFTKQKKWEKLIKVLYQNYMYEHLHSMLKTSTMFQNNSWKTVRGVAPTRYPLSIHFDSISCQKNETKFTKEKKWEKIIKVLYQNHMYAHLHSMLKTSTMFQNNQWKTVGGVASTRYPLSIHFDSISYWKKKVHKAENARKNNQRIISKPHARLHSTQKTSEKFQNNRWKTVRGVAPTTYPVYFHLKGQLNLEIP